MKKKIRYFVLEPLTDLVVGCALMLVVISFAIGLLLSILIYKKEKEVVKDLLLSYIEAIDSITNEIDK